MLRLRAQEPPPPRRRAVRPVDVPRDELPDDRPAVLPEDLPDELPVAAGRDEVGRLRVAPEVPLRR